MKNHIPFRIPVSEYLALATYLLKWLGLTIPLGLLVGSACAFFLWALDRATVVRGEHPGLLYFLPLAGLAVSWLYHQYGKSVESGNNLIVDEIHEPGGGVPLRMAPLVLVGTVMTHLFGGSAGREGTAVQMGGSIASGLAALVPRLPRSDVPTLLMAGVAAGFGGVFGTPVAGMIFTMEVIALGKVTYGAILPCLVAAIAADQSCLAWGIQHTHYHVESRIPVGGLNQLPGSFLLLAKVAVAGIVFGLAGRFFSELAHGSHHAFRTRIKRPEWRAAIGGLIIIGLVQLVGTRDYLGLGVASSDSSAVTILSCFREGGAGHWSWLWKTLFTVVTLGCGFKGGEVTPLFFIGAALGNTLAIMSGSPVDLFAAIGFVAVFAGATNTPLACTVMAMELFGGEYAVFYAVACVMAYLTSGHSGIYLSQRIGTPKIGPGTSPRISLREERDHR